MRFADELVAPGDMDIPAPQRKPSKLEVAAAGALVDQLSASFQPEEYEDTYRAALLELIERKARGETIARPSPPGCPRGRPAGSAAGEPPASGPLATGAKKCGTRSQKPGPRLSSRQAPPGARADAQATVERLAQLRPVNVPVTLYSATRDRDIHFQLLHGPDCSPIETRRVCANEKEPVPWAEIARGYELDDGSWVLLSDEDLAGGRAPAEPDDRHRAIRRGRRKSTRSTSTTPICSYPPTRARRAPMRC